LRSEVEVPVIALHKNRCERPQVGEQLDDRLAVQTRHSHALHLVQHQANHDAKLVGLTS
jgi:hypothetical protein